MKKALYGTTALVTGAALMSVPAAAEEGIKLGLGGYMNNYFGVLFDHDEDSAVDRNATGLFSDGEIWFKGETTLDNGITFGANVQLESFGNTGDVIDEDFAYISGNFGRINIGSENTAAYLMHYSAPYVGAPINSGWVTTFIPADGTGFVGPFRTPALSTTVDIGNDENVITYFTPRFSGFQVGATYVPAVVFSGNGKDFPIEADKETEFNNGFSVGANFVESFEGFDISVSGGYRRAEAPDGLGSIEDMEQWSAGLNVGFAGFTVGGSYANEDDDIIDDGESWDVGATYSSGPWTVGATYFNSDLTYGPAVGFASGSATPGEDVEMDVIQGGVGYAVGPGIDASMNIMYADYDTDTGDADGIIGIVGLTYSF
jgi:predicted porin